MVEFELKFEVENFPDMSKYKVLKEKHIVDVYYDTNDYKLISTGNFLRNRNNSKIDFKLDIGDMSHTFCNETSFNYAGFKSNNSIEQIFKSLKIPYNAKFNSFEEFIDANNLSKLAIIDKTRREFKINNMVVSLDEAKNIGKFIEVEIELPDDAEFNQEQLTKQMTGLLTNTLKLSNFTKVNIGYVELYLKKHNIKAYNLGLFKGWL